MNLNIRDLAKIHITNCYINYNKIWKPAGYGKSLLYRNIVNGLMTIQLKCDRCENQKIKTLLGGFIRRQYSVLSNKNSVYL